MIGTSALGLVLQNVRFVSLARDTLAGALRCRICSARCPRGVVIIVRCSMAELLHAGGLLTGIMRAELCTGADAAATRELGQIEARGDSR